MKPPKLTWVFYIIFSIVVSRIYLLKLYNVFSSAELMRWFGTCLKVMLSSGDGWSDRSFQTASRRLQRYFSRERSHFLFTQPHCLQRFFKIFLAKIERISARGSRWFDANFLLSVGWRKLSETRRCKMHLVRFSATHLFSLPQLTIVDFEPNEKLIEIKIKIATLCKWQNHFHFSNDRMWTSCGRHCQ